MSSSDKLKLPEIRFLTPEEDQQLTDLAEDIAQQMLGPDWKERQEQRRAALSAKNVRNSISAAANAIIAVANVNQLSRASLTPALSRRSAARSAAPRKAAAWVRATSSLNAAIFSRAAPSAAFKL